MQNMIKEEKILKDKGKIVEVARNSEEERVS